MVVILGSLLDDLLLDRLQGVFVEMTEAQSKSLVKAGGLLANFDDRITLARALGLIDDGATETLRIVKTMRNACAHSRLPLTFTTPELSNVLALCFDDETAQAVRESILAPTQRILFITLFLILSRVIRGDSDRDAQRFGQGFFNVVRETIFLEVERYNRRKAQRASRHTKSEKA